MSADWVAVEEGDRPCRECGKKHWRYADRNTRTIAPSWADQGDGHPYRPYSWREMWQRSYLREQQLQEALQRISGMCKENAAGGRVEYATLRDAARVARAALRAAAET